MKAVDTVGPIPEHRGDRKDRGSEQRPGAAGTRGHYWAIIGDIIQSRHLTGRDLFQRRLETIMTRASEMFEGGLAARWVITAGDEFQGLYSAAAAPELPRVTEFLFDSLHPVGIRLGIGVGGLSTDLKLEAVGMDGPCFHRARAALDFAKRRRKLVAVAGAEGVSSSLTDLWDLYAKMAAGRTPAQRRAAEAYKKTGNQYRAAEQLGVSQATVSAHLSRAMFFEGEATLNHMGRALAAFAEGEWPL